MTAPPAAPVAPDDALQHNLLDEPLIRYRRAADGATVQATLPDLFVAMAADAVRDFPALRPHQRHPWHAFLCQLAAIALHAAGRNEPFETADAWRAALLALTPGDPDGAAWCLVSPAERPALLQAPAADGCAGWRSAAEAADELDMLVTSKNHDLKSGRARDAQPEDWLYALVSLQTQEGVLGSGKYGISRMNGGFANRPGVGIAPVGRWGRRWRIDVQVLLSQREHIASIHGLKATNGHALLWLPAWDGTDSLAFDALDPLYIEICRRVRLVCGEVRLRALDTSSKVARISAKALHGITGDPWTPVDTAAAKALTISDEGFHYKLMAELLFGSKYTGGAAQTVSVGRPDERLRLVARGVARGQGKTEGYHERNVPIAPKVRGLLAAGQRDKLDRIAQERITAIGGMHDLLKDAIVALFAKGIPFDKISKKTLDNLKKKAGTFSRPFEHAEDARFFDDLTAEVESDDPVAERLRWLIGLAERAEALLRAAFDAGPRSGMQRYRAQAAALSRLRGGLRGPKSPFPDLADHYRQLAARTQEEHDVQP